MRARLPIVLAALALASCAARPRMCVAPSECGQTASCVAGRCLPSVGTPAIQSARRMVYEPVDIAFIRPGDGARGGVLPPIASLGRASDSSALLLLRFRVPISKDAKIIEAYLLMDRTTAIDADPMPIVLHAARIIEPWDGRSISWALLPRIEETRSPSTTVEPSGRGAIRLDVRALVEHWRLHEKSDQGLAVVSESTSPSGMPIAMTSFSDAPTSGAASEPRAATSTPTFGAFGVGALSTAAPAEVSAPILRQGPRLELYVK
jgi:hypothetical protein